MKWIRIDGQDYNLNMRQQPITAQERIFKKALGYWKKRGFYKLNLRVGIDGDPIPLDANLIHWTAKTVQAQAAVKTSDLKELANGKEIMVYGIYNGEAKEYKKGFIIVEEG